MVHGRRETDSLGVAPASRLKVSLDGKYQRFLCQTSALAGSIARASSPFLIYGDGKLLLTQRSTNGTPVNLSVRGLRSLELVAPAQPAGAFTWRHARLERENWVR